MATTTALPTQFAAIFDATGKVFYVDCLLSDNHAYTSEITSFPAETGSDFSDNIRCEPIEVTIECLVSNTPIGWIATQRDTVSEPVSDAHGHMMKIYTDRKPVNLITSIGAFQNMALKSLSVPRNKDNNKETYFFTATFVQIQTVTNKRAVRAATPMATPNTSTNKAPLVQTWTSSNVARQINTRFLEWYDPAIAGWRKGVLGPQSNFPRYQIAKGKPNCLTYDQWNGRTTTASTVMLYQGVNFPTLVERVVHPSDSFVRAINQKLNAQNPTVPKTFRKNDTTNNFKVLVSADLWVLVDVALFTRADLL